MINISVCGNGHLAETLRCGASLRGLQVSHWGGDILLCAQDVLDHSDLREAKAWFDGCLPLRGMPQCPLILVSQVPPGTTRKWAAGQENVFYQVDTIIVKRAVERVTRPEQFVVGCADPEQPLPLAYQQYLAAFDCPVLQMSYESAELAKCAINAMLAAQVATARVLDAAAGECGADYADVERAMHNDARIGQHAYLRPGKINQHLKRDIDTISKLNEAK